MLCRAVAAAGLGAAAERCQSGLQADGHGQKPRKWRIAISGTPGWTRVPAEGLRRGARLGARHHRGPPARHARAPPRRRPGRPGLRGRGHPHPGPLAPQPASSISATARATLSSGPCAAWANAASRGNRPLAGAPARYPEPQQDRRHRAGSPSPHPFRARLPHMNFVEITSMLAHPAEPLPDSSFAGPGRILGEWP